MTEFTRTTAAALVGIMIGYVFACAYKNTAIESGIRNATITQADVNNDGHPDWVINCGRDKITFIYDPIGETYHNRVLLERVERSKTEKRILELSKEASRAKNRVEMRIEREKNSLSNRLYQIDQNVEKAFQGGRQ